MLRKRGRILFIFAFLCFACSKSVWACSPAQEMACYVDKTFYRYKIDRMDNPIPAQKLKVTTTDSYDDKAMHRDTDISFENVSDKPIYLLFKLDIDEPWAVHINGENWEPFKLIKGNPAACLPDASATEKNLSFRELEKLKWACEENFDTCGGSTNHHPVTRSLYSREYNGYGWSASKRKAVPNKPETSSYYFLVDGQIEEVKVTWSIHDNENFLKQKCMTAENLRVNSCAKKKNCWQAKRAEFKFLKGAKWLPPFRVSSKKYTVAVRQIAISPELFFGKEKMTTAKRDEYESYQQQFSYKDSEVKKWIHEELKTLEDEADFLPVEIVLGRLVNQLYAQRMYAFDIKVETAH